MGGTASPLRCNIGYDPIVHITSKASGASTPTYVDDLAALTAGARQTLRASFTLVFASQAAGLVITGHACTAVRCHGLTRRGAAALHDLPVTVETRGAITLASGLPTDLLA
jgi:hypothetical protein